MRKKRPGRKYPRTTAAWKSAQAAAWIRAAGKCEVTGESLFAVKHHEMCDRSGRQCLERGCRKVHKWAAHHVIAERFVRIFLPGTSPHIHENVIAIGVSLHSKITAAENLLMRADWLGYRRELNRLGIPMEVLDQAWSALCHSI